jgi:hypothetical protein
MSSSTAIRHRTDEVIEQGSAMSVSDHSRRFPDVRRMSGLLPASDVSGPGRHFAFGPQAEAAARPGCCQPPYRPDHSGSPALRRPSM